MRISRARERVPSRELASTNIDRGANADPSANSCANFTFHGHTAWELLRYTHFLIPLATGRLTLKNSER